MLLTAISGIASPSFNLFEHVPYQRNANIALSCLDIKLLFSGYAIHSGELMYITMIIHFIDYR